MQKAELDLILKKHTDWLQDKEGGERANLRRANLGGAYLGGADLTGANLMGANLTGANLTDAYFRGANLGGANLKDANLGGANLGGANLGGANLAGANLGGANLTGAQIPLYAYWSVRHNLDGRILIGYKNKTTDEWDKLLNLPLPELREAFYELASLSDHQILRLRAAYLAERLYVSLTTGLDP